MSERTWIRTTHQVVEILCKVDLGGGQADGEGSQGRHRGKIMVEVMKGSRGSI